MAWLDHIPWMPLVLISIMLGLAPWPGGPEPHLVEKVKLLGAGNLSRPIDIFDLLMHSAGPVLVVLKALRTAR